MNNLKPYIIFAIIGLLFCVGLIVWGVIDSKTPQKQDFKGKVGTLFIEGGSAVKGISIPSWFEVETMGIKIITETLDEVIEDLIACESSGNPNAWNKDDPNDGSKGILQYQDSTFQLYCVEKYGLPNNIWDQNIQIKCAKRMLIEGLGEHWSCFKKVVI